MLLRQLAASRSVFVFYLQPFEHLRSKSPTPPSPKSEGAPMSLNVCARARVAVDGVADDLADLRVREEQVVVDDAPALLRGVDHANAHAGELRAFRRADAGDAAGDPARHRERAVGGRGHHGDL